MSDQVWYEVDALTADLTSRRYRVLATSEEGAERKMRDRCPAAVAILVLEDHVDHGGDGLNAPMGSGRSR